MEYINVANIPEKEIHKILSTIMFPHSKIVIFNKFGSRYAVRLEGLRNRLDELDIYTGGVTYLFYINDNKISGDFVCKTNNERILVSKGYYNMGIKTGLWTEYNRLVDQNDHVGDDGEIIRELIIEYNQNFYANNNIIKSQPENITHNY